MYESVEELLGDTVHILGELARDATTAGASCLQFDEPAYTFLLMPGIDQMVKAMGSSAQELMESSLATDRRFLEGLPDGITTAVHVCRGNYASRHMGSGALDPVAEALFSLPFDRFLIEWEGVERERDSSALRHVRDRLSFSACSARRCRASRPRTRSCGTSRKRPSTCRWSSWRSRPSHGEMRRDIFFDLFVNGMEGFSHERAWTVESMLVTRMSPSRLTSRSR